jgi:RNA polymerase sigma factor for flagellar operon FliA
MVASRDARIQQHMHLVPLTRRRVVPNVPAGVEADDLESVGYIGLVKAADRFDAARGVQFVTFAIAMIRGAMLEFMRNDDWVPRSIRRARLRGEAVVVIELLSLEALRHEARDKIDDPEPLLVADQIADPAPGPADLLLAAAEVEALWQRVGRLSKAEQQVICGYYLEGRTIKAIAAGMERSESRGHQIHHEALRRLGQGA